MPLAHAKAAFLDSLGTFGVPLRGREPDKPSRARSRRATRRPSRLPGAHPEPEPNATPVAVVGPGAPVASRRRAPTTSSTHGSVVIAAITSCTNTSNPQVMVGAGLLAKKAVERGLERKPWVKSSLAPGSKVVTEYYDRAGLTPYLERARLPHRRLRLHDLHRQLRPAAGGDLRRRRRGRPRRLRRALGQPQLRGAHPPRGEGELPRLAAARRRLRARRADGHRPARASRSAQDADGNDVYLRDIWPSSEEITETIAASVHGEMFTLDVRRRLHRRRAVAQPARARRASSSPGSDDSTYVRLPPYFEGMALEPGTVEDIAGARCLVMLGDSVTTDHISPGRRDQARVAGRAATSIEHGDRAAGTSTPTARGAATTR